MKETPCVNDLFRPANITSVFLCPVHKAKSKGLSSEVESENKYQGYRSRAYEPGDNSSLSYCLMNIKQGKDRITKAKKDTRICKGRHKGNNSKSRYW